MCSLELLQLKYFKTVAKTGKISTAAQELFLSAPALSTSINRLEKEVGTPLFDRTGNRITLNEQGEIFLRHVTEVFDTLDRAKSELRYSLLRQQQHIWLSTSGSNLWLELLAAFSQEYPQLTLTCSTTKHTDIGSFFTQYTFLLAEEEDIPENCAASLDRLRLFEDQPAILVHPDHPLAQEERVAVSALRSETLFLPMHDMPRWQHMAHLLESNGIDPATANSSTYVIYRNMVEQNLGIALTTLRSVHVNLGDLRVIPLESKLSPWVMGLFWHRDHIMTPAEETFRSFVARYYQA